MKLQVKLKKRATGFTIIELLIATAVFSVILLIMVVAIIGFFKGYYKALAATSTQNASQNVSDIVEDAIKLSTHSGGTTNNAPTMQYPSANSLGYFCVGSTEFAYYLGEPHTISSGPPFVLYELSEPSCQTTLAALQSMANQASWNSKISLLGDNYRLLVFSVSPINPIGTTHSWSVHIKLAYTTGGTNDAGDDLLCSPSLPSAGNGGCQRPPVPAALDLSYAQLTALPTNDITCRSGAGSQFCDISELQSIVETRLSP